MNYTKARVVSNEKVVDGIFKLIVEDKNQVNAGQFYMLKLKGQTLLPRPISICTKDINTVTFLYSVVGRGTEEFSNLSNGDFIDIFGPLGNGFEIKNYQRIALVSGGIGIAPMLELAKRLRKYNQSMVIDLYAGFRDDIYLITEFDNYIDNAIITTNTGKYGHKGFVTDLLDVKKYNTVLCCGPEIMMKNVVDICKNNNTEVFVSMEKHMACGVGACLVCTCKTNDGHKRTCKDGPVFNGNYVEL